MGDRSRTNQAASTQENPRVRPDAVLGAREHSSAADTASLSPGHPGSNDLSSTEASSPNSTGGAISPRVLHEWVIAADRRMEEADRRMAAADARVVAAEERLAKLQRIVARAEVDRELLKSDIAAAELQAREMDRELKAARDRARNFEERMHEQAAYAANYLERLRAREAELRCVFESWSWRVTSSFRNFKQAAVKTVAQGSRTGSMLAPIRTTDRMHKLKRGRRIFLECTHTYQSDLNTGIQRVVRNVLRYSISHAKQRGYEIIPVIIEGDQLVYADPKQVLKNKQATVPDAKDDTQLYRRFVRGIAQVFNFKRAHEFLDAPSGRFGFTFLLLLPFRLIAAPFAGLWNVMTGSVQDFTHNPVRLDDFNSHEDHILVLLDSSWTIPIWSATRNFKALGGKVVGVIYDLIPVTHPHTSVEHLTKMFGNWLERHLETTDGFLAISNTVSQQLAHHFENKLGVPINDDRRGYFHLGSELDFAQAGVKPRGVLRELFACHEHIFLMVGSIEPRKKHEFVLDAFEAHWREGGTSILLICGKQAWKTEDLLDRISKHPMLDERLVILRDANDDEIDYCYKHASALVIASEIEGFGLPVVEAFQRGLPVLCSDIPVFREIAEGRASFFSIDTPSKLVVALKNFVESHDLEDREARHPFKWLTWEESSEKFVEEVLRLAGASR
jgi:O-antigen biosynthesis alpha-1,2-rhamnosyltransferase